MLQPGQQGYQGGPPPPQPYQDQGRSYAPPQQNYDAQRGQNYDRGYDRPPPQQGYNAPPHQQQQRGYDPKNAGDVGSLLAMLNR